jgi:sialate O-acetylesterase
VYTTLTKNKDTGYINRTNRNAAFANAMRPKQKDAGIATLPWYDTSYIPKEWHSINVPGYWEDQGLRNLDGIVWYRKEIDVPRELSGKPARIYLGRIVDADFLYINGQTAGITTYQYPQRRYTLPSGLKPGKNIIVVRVINNFGKGGFVPDKPYKIIIGEKTIDLKGEWQYKVGDVFTPQQNEVSAISFQNQPSALYNAMIAPLINYAIKGFLWYQGEANSGRAAEYEKLFPALIMDWRKKWALGDLPFLYVQLPNFMEVNYLPSESQWASLRDAQLKTLSVPNTGMAVAIDLGEWNDIHPDRKKEVGDRLALLAEKMVYGNKSVIASGPLYQSIKRDGSKLVINFSNTGSGLLSKDSDELKWFAIAGPDQKYVWANAKIEGDHVIASNESIPDPVYVRYAWADNPVDVNFYNREGLPASPFAANILPGNSNATSGGPWNHKGCAVVLTYDDALNVHIDNARPLLDSLGLKATFYVSGYSGVLNNRMEEWRKMAANGHELGNHTLYHPCSGGLQGRDFVMPDTDLDHYTVSKMVSEIRMTNTLLHAIDGKTERTFAYPCGDTKIGGVSYIDAVKSEFTGARGVQFALQDVSQVDLFDIKCYGVNGQSGDELVAAVKKAMEQHKLLVFLFHGVGGEHGLNVSLEAHRQLLQFLKAHEDEIWIAPMTTVASFIKQQTQKN